MAGHVPALAPLSPVDGHRSSNELIDEDFKGLRTDRLQHPIVVYVEETNELYIEDKNNIQIEGATKFDLPRLRSEMRIMVPDTRPGLDSLHGVPTGSTTRQRFVGTVDLRSLGSEARWMRMRQSMTELYVFLQTPQRKAVVEASKAPALRVPSTPGTVRERLTGGEGARRPVGQVM